ncbi:hypothetical protein B0A55_00850 [Friedmanniomyces simplex]|uniref:Uncharacterized protein n=1 Tax=Friedmanniomyces simplex TaxID=329884 RepID=A0A4U0Y3J6_9PEZI|nr:hypothetical protein B0A55_00850 [Friedmanniomyces simplex]
MPTTDDMAPIERRKSHGIGGAGNMHLPSVIKKATDTLDNTKDQQRRGSAWSRGSSGSSRRSSIVDKIFRRGSKTEEKPAVSS